MPESSHPGPGGYQEVSGTAGIPHAQAASSGPAQAAVPFTPPDTTGLGPGPSAGGTAGPGGNHGGGLAGAISGIGTKAVSIISDVLPEAVAL